MRLIIAILLIFTLTACNSPTESANNEESNTREMTEEEQNFIDLIKNDDFEKVISLTENGNSELQKDYYNMVSALQKFDELKVIQGKSDDEIASGYSYILTTLEDVKFIPEQLKEQINDAKSYSQFQMDFYASGKYIEPKIYDSEEVTETNDNNSISIGMTSDEVIKILGKPNDINRTITAYGTDEQWVYYTYYLYFEDGILTAIQD